MKDIEEARFDDKDVLCRKGIAEQLIKLFTSENNFSPIVLHGVWGSGKSVFCHQFKNLILDETRSDLKVVYINAFQFDYTDDPFLMILGNILKTIGYQYENKKLISCIKSIFKQVLKIFCKQGTGMIINKIPIPDEYKQVLKETYQEIYKLYNKNHNTMIDEILKSFGQMNEQISEFKKVLQQVISNTNMVVIIDELDRCRPSFAIEILERVKHIFDIPNLHFLLSMDTQVLEATIEKLYGYNQKAEEYLNKFYTYKITFPSIVKSSGERATLALFKEKIKQENKLDYTMKVVESYYKYKNPLLLNYSLTHASEVHHLYNNRELPVHILYIAQWITEQYDITLRDIDKVINNIQLYYSLQDFPQSFEEVIVEFYALFLYTVDKSLFDRFRDRRITATDDQNMTNLIAHTPLEFVKKNLQVLRCSILCIISAVDGSFPETLHYIMQTPNFREIYENLNIRHTIFSEIEEILHFFSQS